MSEFEGFVEKLGAMRSTGRPAGSGLDGAGDGRLVVPDVTYIPISALDGDNVVERSQRMDWYQDPARHPVLLDLLEEVEVAYDHPHDRPARFPVQWVIRPENRNRSTPGSEDYRGYAGQLASGSLRVGEEVVALPSGQRTRIAAIDTYEGEIEEALAPMSVTLRLEDDLDVSRGELICRAEQSPTVARELQADVCWLNERPLRAGGKYVIKHTTRTATAIVDELGDRVDVSTLERVPAPARARAQRHRPGTAAYERAARLRPICRQPPHGQLHPDRRGDQRDRRRRAWWGLPQPDGRGVSNF